jgi:acyl carrier protein
VHYACKDIEAGRVDYAIAGGVNIILGNTFTNGMKSSGFLSKDQRCKTFDDSANGYVRAEGGGLVLLVNKELVEQYYAEILGSAINQNGGRTQVITAPHPEAQEELILDACQDAAILPTDLDYIECHGTGTKIGDPIEISALQNTIGKDRKTQCFLGSVKSNIGHLESAAGIAGLLKSVLVLHYGTIPANLHFTTPNHFIDFASYHLTVVDKETPIGKQALVGVSSFGFGGANAHVILKGAEEAQRKQVQDLPSPFDKTRATPLAFYDQLQRAAEAQSQSPNQMVYEPVEPVASGDIGEAVAMIFLALTGITSIETEVELTNQGLDSLSATQFLTTLQERFGVELDSDLLFDYPFIDDLVNILKEKLTDDHNREQKQHHKAELSSLSARTKLMPLRYNKDDIAALIAATFYELTNVSEINPAVELTAQGLDSLSATQFISQLEAQLKIEIDADILFEYPLYDQLVDRITLQCSPVQEEISNDYLRN